MNIYNSLVHSGICESVMKIEVHVSITTNRSALCQYYNSYKNMFICLYIYIYVYVYVYIYIYTNRAKLVSCKGSCICFLQ